MKKDAYWFSHDSNSKNDEKVIRLRMRLGWEGYGLYWALIEMLRDANNYQLETEYETIAFELRTECERISEIVNDFELFSVEDGLFWSVSLVDRMRPLDEKKAKNKKIAVEGWVKRKAKQKAESDANALRTESGGNTYKSKVKETITEEKKLSKEEREKDFRSEVSSLLPNDSKTANDFCNWWTESNPKGRKMKFEMQKTFDIPRRITTWKDRQFKSKTEKPSYKFQEHPRNRPNEA